MEFASLLQSVYPSQQSHSIYLPSKNLPFMSEMHSSASFSFLNLTQTIPSGCVQQNLILCISPNLLIYSVISFFTDYIYQLLSTCLQSSIFFSITIFKPSPCYQMVSSHENCFFQSILDWIFFAKFCFFVYRGLQPQSFWLNCAFYIFIMNPLLIYLPFKFYMAIYTLYSLAYEIAASPFGKPFSSLQIFSFYRPVFKSILSTPALLMKSLSYYSVTSNGKPEIQIKVLIFALYHFSFFFYACLFAFFLFFSRFKSCYSVNGTYGSTFYSTAL